MFDNTMFENDLQPGPSVRKQIVAHLPIAVIVVGLVAAFVALHVAVTGLLVAAAAHVLLGAAVFVARRHRESK